MPGFSVWGIGAPIWAIVFGIIVSFFTDITERTHLL
jgi:predicted benzoate:H+ symporter BenE